MKEMEKAIKNKDFDKFAELTIRDSNQFHAVCLDTYPPIFYLNDVSKKIISLMSAYNQASLKAGKGYKVAYTFDAGPNAVLFTPSENIKELLTLVNAAFPPSRETLHCYHSMTDYFGPSLVSMVDEEYGQVPGEGSIFQRVLGTKENEPPFPMKEGLLHRLIHTQVGDGPRVLVEGYDPKISLLNESGLPPHLASTHPEHADKKHKKAH
jgi:diphosphomevalonate decarboxylase